MKTSTRFVSALIVALLAGLLAIYDLIPGLTHLRPMGGATTSPAIGMAVILFGLALIAGIIAVRMQLKRNRE